ncbi:MAG: cytochrome c [Candidatus Obscuribacterales bacterium]|nr:cytochrome c [Candidatus Obscuribacterales bacterium]
MSKRLLLAICAVCPATIALIVGGAYLTVVTGVINPGADEPIPPLEKWAAKTSLRAYLKSHTPKVTNPVTVTDDNLHDGIDLYVQNCAACHGFADGAKTKIAQGMYKQPNCFGKEDWSKEDDGLIYWFINHGVRLTGMPAFGKTLTEDEQWRVVLLIKNMPNLSDKSQKYWQSFKH